jgi:hypothetical protein
MRSPRIVFLEIDVGQLLRISVAHDEASFEFSNRPWWWEATGDGINPFLTSAVGQRASLWHMGLLRIILLVVAAILWAFLAYIVIDSSIIHPHKEPILDYFIVYGILIYLGVNFIYLISTR